MPHCAWKNHYVETIHVVNKDCTTGFCEPCSTEVLHSIQFQNVKRELPHLYEGEERRQRPTPKPFKDQ